MSFISTKSEAIGESNSVQNVHGETVSTSPQLPENPIVSINPSKSGLSLNLSELWQYRDLLYILTMRDIRVRYKQTALGAAWAIVQPLFTMLVFSLFFGRIIGVPSDEIPYPLFVYAGLTPWLFFSNALTKSGNSLVGNANLITKVYFPRMVIPISAVAVGILDFLIASAFLLALMFYYDFGFSLNFLMLPILVLIVSLLAIGLGLLLSGLNVKYRDVGHALPFLIQLGMFVTPIIYPLSIVPEKWRWIVALNPMTGIVEGFRSAFFAKPFDWFSLGLAAIITIVILIYAAYAFRRMEDDFADVI